MAGQTYSCLEHAAAGNTNALFAGHDIGAENWATVAWLVETSKLTALNPLACLIAALTATVNGQKQNRIDDLMPWNYSGRTNG